MQYRPLGSTSLEVSEIAFGAGPVSGLMTGDSFDRQLAVVAEAIESGINWFDTAATYGAGQSEASLGRVLRQLNPKVPLHIATKVRVLPEQLDNFAGAVRESVESSLRRLGVERLALVQLHNSVTARRGDESTSLTPADVLGPGGVADTLERLRDEGLLAHLGLTGIGQPDALREVIDSGRFQTVQTPYSLLNPSAGRAVPKRFTETDFGNIAQDCARQSMGLFAIRVLAGGALTGQPASQHTHQTKFFPLDLFERDVQRSRRLEKLLPEGMTSAEAAVRFVLSNAQISAAIIGFADPDQVRAAVRAAEQGPLPAELTAALDAFSIGGT